MNMRKWTFFELLNRLLRVSKAATVPAAIAAHCRWPAAGGYILTHQWTKRLDEWEAKQQHSQKSCSRHVSSSCSWTWVEDHVLSLPLPNYQSARCGRTSVKSSSPIFSIRTNVQIVIGTETNIQMKHWKSIKPLESSPNVDTCLSHPIGTLQIR